MDASIETQIRRRRIAALLCYRQALWIPTERQIAILETIQAAPNFYYVRNLFAPIRKPLYRVYLSDIWTLYRIGLVRFTWSMRVSVTPWFAERWQDTYDILTERRWLLDDLDQRSVAFGNQ